MRFWSATGYDPDNLDLVSDDPPLAVRESKPYRDAVTRAKREANGARVTISHHESDDTVRIVYDRTG